MSPRNIISRTARRGLSLVFRAGHLLRRIGARPGPPCGPKRDGEESLISQLPVVPRDRRLAVLRMIEAALDNHAVDYRTCLTDTSAYCAVSSSSLDGLCTALNALGHQYGSGQVHVWSGVDFDYDRHGFAESLASADIAQCHSVVVGMPVRVGQYRLDLSGGAEILIIDDQGARRIARRRRAKKVDWTSDFAAGRISSPPTDGSQRRTDGGSKEHLLEDAPIDVVYTWVDSEDGDWDDARRAWARREGTQLDSADNVQRYANRDELRYSLRSLWLYAPFIRNIFVVTAGHCPRWLNSGHERIHVVSHEEIFPDPKDLPTFNSHAIEACLHRIPDLAEHFIYFNDDVLLGRETTAETFFTKTGLMKCRFSTVASIPVSEPDSSSTPTDWAAYNAAAILARDFGIRFDRKMKHVPMPLRRSVIYELENLYADHFSRTRRARFRSMADIAVPSMLAHFYAIRLCKAVEWEHVPGEYAYADTGRADFEEKLTAMTSESATFLCLNSTRHNDIPRSRQDTLLRRFLMERYPIPSPFELTEESGAPG